MHLSSRRCSRECTKAHTLLIAAHSLQGAALGLQSRRILSFLINCVIHTKETLFTHFIPPPTGLRTAFDRIMFSSQGHVLHEDLLSFSSIARIDIFYLLSKRSFRQTHLRIPSLQRPFILDVTIIFRFLMSRRIKVLR